MIVDVNTDDTHERKMEIEQRQSRGNIDERLPFRSFHRRVV